MLFLLAKTHADTMIQHKANKDYYDPRKWVREGEVTMRKRVELALEDFNTKGQVDNTSSA